MYLPDINLWLALTFESHFHHRPAREWFDVLPDNACAFCRTTQQGFLRLSTNPSAMGESAVPLGESWRLYDLLLSDPRVRFAPEPPDLEKVWREYTQSMTFSPKVWNDAFLVAFARVGSLTLATFDRGLLRYKDAPTIVLA